jgi:DNA-binding response OmpR family regulator
MTSFQTISPPQVLVVEDDVKLATLLCRVLRDDGLSAEAVFDWRTALRRLSTEPFAVVLLDDVLAGRQAGATDHLLKPLLAE